MNKTLFGIGVSLAVFAVFLLWSVAAVAHGGGLDSNGCHNNRSLGIYECHRGDDAGRSFESREEYEAIITHVPDWTTFNARLASEEDINNPFRVKEDRFTVSDEDYVYYLEMEERENGLYYFVRVYDRKKKFKPLTFKEALTQARERTYERVDTGGQDPFRYIAEKRAEERGRVPNTGSGSAQEDVE